MRPVSWLPTRLLATLTLAVLSIMAPLSPPASAQGAQTIQGFADLPGVRIWYTDSGGAGVPVVLLHAATGTTESWQHNVGALAAAGYRVITFDRRGWGRTVANPDTGPQPGTASDDLQALANNLGLAQFHLVGIAAGGSVAYDYAIGHPERLRSLTVAASGGGGLQDDTLAEMKERSALPGFAEWPIQYRELGLAYLAANPEGVAQWVEVTSNARQAGAPTQPPRNEVSFAGLESISVPALLLAGDADVSNPPWVIRMQAEHIPGSEFVIIAESGHSINWEQPEAFNNTLIDFMNRH